MHLIIFSYRQWLSVCLLLTCTASVQGDGPADNLAHQVRPVPPPGIELSPEVSHELRESALKLQQNLAELSPSNLAPAELRKRDFCAVIPRAVLMTLDTNMFYNEKEIDAARELLQIGSQRLEALASGASELQVLGADGDSPHGLSEPLPLAAGFRSRIDGSVQPYGVILPAGYRPQPQRPLRLDVWLHGRGEKVSEVAFLQQRMKQLGEYTPADTIVLHPYGRYCNAFKFAGEIDVLEAIEHVQQWLPIDDRKIVIRGFSMGGAGCWQLAVHYPHLWAAANPGAGFSETTEFLRVFQQELIKPTAFQKRLLHWYDCPDWTNNLRHVPTVAYSGEKDRQKQAADVMATAFTARGMELPHVIGPDTEHKIHGDSKPQIEQFLSQAVQAGKPRLPRTIDLTTYSLRYHRLGWLSIEGLTEHWRESRVQAEWLEDQDRIELTTQGVTHLSLQFPPLANDDEDNAGPMRAIKQLSIDGQELNLSDEWTSPQQPLHVTRRSDSTWQITHRPQADVSRELRKRPGSQGPIDDAFMDKFVLVGPDSTASGSKVDAWAQHEFERAAREWKGHFRGDPPIADSPTDNELTLQQNVVLFGQPSSNRLIAKLVEKLPISWTDDALTVNGKSYSTETHAPILIYPNPFSPDHYVVINSGFTYREYAYLNNARQVPVLPDWAVVDVARGITTQLPGQLKDAGFFNEKWQFGK